MGTATRRSVGGSTYFKPAPSEINYGKMRFLITDRPSDNTITNYIQKSGIDVLDWEFNDGGPPPPEVIHKWMQLIKDSVREHPQQCIAVHCVAGLGRAPVLVAIALIEAGMKFDDAVELIRRERRGALNQKQLEFLSKYKSTGELRKLRYSVDGKAKACCIM